MKNKKQITNLIKKEKSRIIVTLVGRYLLVLTFLVANTSFAQTAFASNKVKAGAALFSQLSANGYGGQTLPLFYISKGRRSYFMGPVIQNRSFNLSGIHFNYTYSLTGPQIAGHDACEPELFVFLSGAYNFNALLGRAVLREEELTNPLAEELNVSAMRFRSTEIFAGFGLKVKLFKRFKFTNAIGLGGYYSFGFPDKSSLFYNGSNIGLVLKSGISFDIL